MTTSTLLTQVPREIWEIILLNLPYYEDLVVASLTCNLWHNILADHLVCPAKCSVAAYGWKVDQPFVYNFLPGTPPSEKDEKLPLDRAVNHWVTWPHVPLCFEIVLRDRRERGPQFKSRAHYGLSVRWVFRGLIPYMEKDHRRMDIDPSQRLGVATGQSHTQHTPQGAGVGGALRDSGSLREPMAVEVVGHVEGQHTVVDGPRPDDDAHAEVVGGEREPKRARSRREAGLTESQEMGRRAQQQQNDDILQQARQMLGLGVSSVGGGEQQQMAVDVERHIVRVGGPDDAKREGQFAFYAKQLFMMRGERLKEVVSSLVDEARRERRNDENVAMVGLIVERVKDEDIAGSGNSATSSGGSNSGSGSGGRWRGEAPEATMMLREGEWRCVGGRSGVERRDDDEGDDQDHTTTATTSAAQAEGAGSKGTGGVLMVDQQAAPVPAEQKGKSFMAGFYIPHMDKYAFGTDTLVFELHVQVGGAHIPGSPFLLAFFNPLLP